MISHADAITIIETLREMLPRAPELAPAEWARLVVARQAVHDFAENGPGLPQPIHAELGIIDETFIGFASRAWPAFQAECPRLAQIHPAWWTRLRDAPVGQATSPVTSPQGSPPGRKLAY